MGRRDTDKLKRSIFGGQIEIILSQSALFQELNMPVRMEERGQGEHHANTPGGVLPVEIWELIFHELDRVSVST